MQQGCRFACGNEWASLHVTEGCELRGLWACGLWLCDDDREPQSTQSVPRLQSAH